MFISTYPGTTVKRCARCVGWVMPDGSLQGAPRAAGAARYCTRAGRPARFGSRTAHHRSIHRRPAGMGARRTGGEVRAAVEGDEHGGEPGSPGVGSEDWRCLVCRLKEGTEANDMSHVQHVIRFIAGYVEPPLPIDVQSVFRRSVVDGYINHLIATGRERGARQNQYLYYAVGRLVHPREYPLSRAASKKPKRRTAAPASDTLIADWYRTAASLSGEQQRRAYVSLDLALGAGVRQGELSRVRGTSISSTTYFGREHAVVTLPNRAGGVRHVPVVDVARRNESCSVPKRWVTRA